MKCVLAALLMVGSALAQEPGFLERDHVLIDHWTVDDGLPVNAVNALAQTPDGYLWLATFDGLVRFDGSGFVVFNRATHPELPSNRFIKLQWAAGYLWISTEDRRLVRMSASQTFEIVDEALGLPFHQVGTVFATDDALFVGTLKGVVKMRPDGRFDPVSPGFEHAVLALAPFPGGGLAAGTLANGLFVLEPGHPPRPVPVNDFQKIVSLVSNDNLLAIAANRGVAIMDRERVLGTRTVESDPLDGSHVAYAAGTFSAYLNPDLKHLEWNGTDWETVGTIDTHPIDRGKIVAVGPDGRRWTNALQSLKRSGETLLTLDSRISDFLIDQEGQAWVAADRRGLYRIRPRPVLAIGRSDGFRVPNLISVFEDAEGLVAGGFENFAYRIDLGGTHPEVMEFEAPGAHLARLNDSQGRQWRAGNTLCRVRGEACEIVAAPALDSIQRQQFIRTLFEDSRNNIWLGADRAVAFLREGSDWQVIDRPWASELNSFRATLETPDGLIWFATNGEGIAIVENFEFTQQIDSSRGLSSDRVRALYYDASREAVWAGTQDGGICRIRNWAADLQIDCITSSEGLWSNGVHRIIADDDQRLWMSSNTGIFWADLQSLHAVADGAADWVIGMAFDNEDGMLSAEANGGVDGAGILASNGWLWFPTTEGLVGIKPSDVAAAATVQPRIDAIIYGSARQNASSRFELAPDNRNIEIRFSAPMLRNVKRVRFRYRLAGLDERWIDAQGRRFATLNALPQGDLRFEVEASRTDGSWSGQRASLTLRVLPRLHETLWFQALVAATLLGLLAAAMAWRLRALAQRQRVLESAVELRTSELSEALKQIEANAEARSRLFGNISHELRTPLSLILGPMEEREKRNRPVTAEDEAMILRNARRLRRMVDQILDLERVESGELMLKLEPINGAELVAAVAEPFAWLARQKDLAWTVDLEADCRVEGDREQLEKVFANLFSNAVKYTPAGGSVTIRSGREKNLVWVTVEDSGPGIPSSDTEEAFARFSRLRRHASEPGSGIGLSLVRELVELHQGQASIDTSPTLGGARICVTLPYSPLAASSQESGHGERQVLIVDDNEDLRRYLASILAPHFRVHQANGGVEGLAKAREHLPDVIVTDVMMPDLDGLSMVRELRRGGDEASIPVVFVTARGGASDEIAALAAGGDQYVAKPFESDVLLARVNAVMATAKRLDSARMVAPSTRESVCERIHAFVLEHIQDPDLNVNSVAEALGMSRSSLFRQVKTEQDITPVQLIRDIRLAIAKGWLEHEDARISEIAYGAGFASLSSFGRAFREAFGISATDYRNRQAGSTTDG